MIFGYGSKYDKLDKINSTQLLMNYLHDNIHNPCLEIYLYVDLERAKNDYKIRSYFFFERASTYARG